MKLSNFRNYRRDGRSAIDWRLYATVDVTTGFLWWKKKTARHIARTYAGAGFWIFVDDGSHTPGYQAEQLELAANAQRGMRGEPVFN
jgi:hypothetical protein